jgi:hypothetical protein
VVTASATAGCAADALPTHCSLPAHITRPCVSGWACPLLRCPGVHDLLLLVYRYLEQLLSSFRTAQQHQESAKLGVCLVRRCRPVPTSSGATRVVCRHLMP